MTTQDIFRAPLLDAALPVPDGLVDGAGRDATRRFGVYRNNVVVSLVEAMRTAFPLVRALLGDQNFDGLARMHVQAHPPCSPLMMFYGTDFPAFLEGFEGLKHIGYLPDAARLDLALRRAYHAADSVALTATDLAAIAPEALTQTTFALCPATRIVPSRWPLYDIWRFNTQVGADKPRAVAQDVLITRPAFDPAPHLLPVGAALWLDLLNQGIPFADAFEQTSQAAPAFDLAAALTLALTTGALRKRPEEEAA